MYQQYINGKLVDGLGKPLDVLDPSTGEVVGTVGSANAAQAQQALELLRILPALLQKLRGGAAACVAQRLQKRRGLRGAGKPVLPILRQRRADHILLLCAEPEPRR